MDFLTVLPTKVDSIAPTSGTPIAFKFCLPSGHFNNGFLRIRGPKFGDEFIPGGVILIVGISNSGQNIDRGHMEFSNTTWSDVS